MPRFEDLDWSGSDMTRTEFEPMVRVDTEAWQQELTLHREWFEKLQDRLPIQFALKHELLALRLTHREAVQ
jgi:phosphoenolpyruvate carboxykinase (GTP)